MVLSTTVGDDMKKRFELKTQQSGWVAFDWDGSSVTSPVYSAAWIFGPNYVCKAKSLEDAIIGAKVVLSGKGQTVVDMKVG